MSPIGTSARRAHKRRRPNQPETDATIPARPDVTEADYEQLIAGAIQAIPARLQAESPRSRLDVRDAISHALARVGFRLLGGQ